MKFKRVFVKGGVKRMRYTIPPLVFSLFRLSNTVLNNPQLAESMAEEEVKNDEDELPMKLPKVDQNKIFRCVSEVIGHIKSQYPDLSLRLYL
jgi:hypothetical protein